MENERVVYQSEEDFTKFIFLKNSVSNEVRYYKAAGLKQHSSLKLSTQC